MEKVMDNTTFVGTMGTMLSIGLSQINFVVSIAAGLATLAYMLIKISREVKSNGK
jgi:hypothetical protein